MNGYPVLDAPTYSETIEIFPNTLTFRKAGSQAGLWNPGYDTRLFADYTAMRPPSPNQTPYTHLPPHCWWDGTDDGETQNYHQFAVTTVSLQDEGAKRASGVKAFVFATYEETVRTRVGRRLLTYSRSDGTLVSDDCIEFTDKTTVTNVKTPELEFDSVSTSSTNCVNLRDDQFGADPNNGSNTFHYALATFESQDSSTPLAIPRWGYWRIYNNSGSPYIYEQYDYNRQTITHRNLRFYSRTTWNQYECPGDGNGNGDGGDCVDECPKCKGAIPAIQSGDCGTVCASSGTLATPLPGWTVSGPLPGSSSNARGWSVSISGQCKIKVCAPCVPASLGIGAFEGPYTAVIGTGSTCTDASGKKVYKVLSGAFTLGKKLVCPDDGTITGDFNCVEVDSPHQYTLVGAGNAVKIAERDGSFTGGTGVFSGVQKFVKLRYNSRMSALFMLGVSSSKNADGTIYNKFSVWKSLDAGQSGEKVGEMAGGSSLIEVIKPAGLLVWMVADDAGAFTVKTSSDLGANFDTITPKDEAGKALKIKLVDSDYDERGGNILVLLCATVDDKGAAGSPGLLYSHDHGATWSKTA